MFGPAAWKANKWFDSRHDVRRFGDLWKSLVVDKLPATKRADAEHIAPLFADAVRRPASDTGRFVHRQAVALAASVLMPGEAENVLRHLRTHVYPGWWRAAFAVSRRDALAQTVAGNGGAPSADAIISARVDAELAAPARKRGRGATANKNPAAAAPTVPRAAGNGLPGKGAMAKLMASLPEAQRAGASAIVAAIRKKSSA